MNNRILNIILKLLELNFSTNNIKAQKDRSTDSYSVVFNGMTILVLKKVIAFIKTGFIVQEFDSYYFISIGQNSKDRIRDTDCTNITEEDKFMLMISEPMVQYYNTFDEIRDKCLDKKIRYIALCDGFFHLFDDLEKEVQSRIQ